MTSDDAPQGKSFFERAETLNANLTRLIEAIGGPLAASGELLRRLRLLLGGAPPADDICDTTSEEDAGESPPDRPDP